MINKPNFPFDSEDREIVHVNSRGAAQKKMGLKIVGLSLLFASIMFGAKYAYDLGRGNKNFADAPLVTAENKPYKVPPKDPGGMQIPYIDKEIYKNLNPGFIDENENVITMPEAETPIEFDEIAALIENDFSDDFTFDDEDEPAAPIVNKKPEPKNKPQTYKLASDGTLKKTSGNYAVADSSSKKINVTKILAKKGDAEIWVQLGTFPNEAEATKAWQNVREKNADVLGAAKVKISKSDLGENGIFYRLQSGPFRNESEARDICRAMNEREQNCFFAKKTSDG